MHLTAVHRFTEPRLHRGEQTRKAGHHPGVELGVGTHVGDQAGQRGAHHRGGEHVARRRNHRSHVSGHAASRAHQRRGRHRERRFVHQLGLARPSPVQRRLRRSGALGDRGQREVRIADFDKQIRGGGQYGSVDARVPGPSGTRGLVNRGRVCFHNATHRIVIASRRRHLCQTNLCSTKSTDCSARVATSPRCRR